MGNYTSDELFHFVGHKTPFDDTGNCDTLLKILHSGWVTYDPKALDWGAVAYGIDRTKQLEREELIVPYVTCFCDIPKEHLSTHIKKYGSFGISFKRDFLVRYGARPVMYFPMSASQRYSIYGRPYLKDIEAIFRSFLTFFADGIPQAHTRNFGEEAPNAELAISALKKVIAADFLAFIKPFNADLPDDDKNNFYMEREWRRLGNIPATPETVESVLVAPGFEQAVREAAPLFADKVSCPRAAKT